MRLARLLLSLLVLGLPLRADAVSRLVVQVNEPGVQVRVDGRPVLATGGRVVANHLAAGQHRLEFQGPDGQVVHAVTLVLADGEDARGRYTLDGGLSMQGGVPAAQAASAAPPRSPVVAAPPPEPPPADTLDPAASTFDMNEGTQSGVGAGSGGARRGSNFDGYRAQQVAVGVARGAAVVAAPNAVNVASAGASVASGAARMIRNSPGGAPGTWGSSPAPRQGRPTPPEAEMGTVTLVSMAEEPYTVYLDGFVVAQLGPGKPSQHVRLEVGRHLLELWDGDTNQVRWKGVAELTKDSKMTVRFSDDTAPSSPDRAWAWSGR